MKSPSELTVRLATGAATTALVYAASDVGPGEPSEIGSEPVVRRRALILAHGAGAGQRSSFMVDFADALSSLGLDVVTFNFPYTEQRRKIPDRAAVLESCYRDVVAAVRRDIDSARRLLCIGGKSMGGRIATQIAAADPTLPVAGLVLLGYPLHPPGRPLERRDKHLPAVGRPVLFVQGSRDAFGTSEELTPVVERLQPAATLHVVPHGDHSFKLSKRDPVAQAAVYAAIQQAIVVWVRALTP